MSRYKARHWTGHLITQLKVMLAYFQSSQSDTESVAKRECRVTSLMRKNVDFRGKMNLPYYRNITQVIILNTSAQ